MYKIKKIFIILLFLIFLLFIFLNLNIIVYKCTDFMANIYTERNMNVKLENLLKNNFYFQSRIFNSKSDIVILSAKNLLLFYKNQGLLEQYEKFYEETFLPYMLFYNKKTSVFFDNEYENIASLYSTLGDIKFAQNKYVEAEINYKKSLEYKTKEIQKGRITEWRDLNKLAKLKIKQKKYSEAETYIDETILLYRKYNDDLSWEIYDSLYLLHKEQGNYDLAKYYMEYLLLNSPSIPDIKPIPDNTKAKKNFILETAKLNSYFKKNLADIYILENKSNEALNLLKQSLIIDKCINDTYSICIMCDHYKLFKLFSLMNNQEGEKAEYLEIMNMKEQFLSTKDFSKEQLLNKLEGLCNETEVQNGKTNW